MRTKIVLKKNIWEIVIEWLNWKEKKTFINVKGTK